MDPSDPALQNMAAFGWKPLLTLGLFAGIGAFFFGALITALRRGIKEEGWLGGEKKNNDPS